mgnify:CR=1 FL=1
MNGEGVVRAVQKPFDHIAGFGRRHNNILGPISCYPQSRKVVVIGILPGELDRLIQWIGSYFGNISRRRIIEKPDDLGTPREGKDRQRGAAEEEPSVN